MDLKTRLQELCARHESDLATYAWVSEDDRWAELVFCLLDQCHRQDPETTRSAVTTLQYLDLLESAKLALLDQPAGAEAATVVAYVLKQHGFPPEPVAKSLSVLAHVAQALQRDHGGKMQRYMRRHAEALRDDLVGALSNGALSGAEWRYAVSHWLQNAFSLPLSLEHEAVKEFCAQNEVSTQDLWLAADELDLNLALVDDLLEMEQGLAAAEAEGQAAEES
jgi:hypothetical protein